MSNSSSAGDSLGLSVGRNSENSHGLGVSGIIDVKHQCAETGEVAERSIKNCILLDGVESMLRGLTSFATASGGGVASTKTGIWLSGVASAVDRGVVAPTSTFTSMACAIADTSDRLYPNDADTTLDLSTAIPGFDGAGTSQAGTGGVWFQTSSADIFALAPSGTLPNIDIVSDPIVIKANVTSLAAQIVDGIFVCNQTSAASNYAASTVLLMAGRTTATGGIAASEEFTPAITLAHGDTLTITYTLRITVS
jgi:hypothetical protein